MALSQMPKSIPEKDLPRGLNTKWQKVKAGLFYNKGCSGFLGRLLTTVDLVWTTEVDGAAISTTHLLYNPEVFMEEDLETGITTLAHELWHKGFLHHSRAGTRCSKVWNIAGDYVINNRLEDDGFYMGGFPWLLDQQYRDMSTEEVYDLLQKNPGMIPQDIPMDGDISFIGSDIGEDGNPLPMASDVTSQAVLDVISAVTVGKMQGGMQAGKMPGEVTQAIDEFLNPKLPWDTILYAYFNSFIEDEYSYARPNRRFEDPIMRGRTGRNGLDHLIFSIDISGSISDDTIKRFFTEGKDVQERLEPEHMTMVTFDTDIHDIYELERGDPFEKFEITGRGGTDLEKLFEYGLKHEATAMIIFTDLYVDIPPDPGFPIIWICVDSDETEVPYGKLIKFDEDESVSV
jgi:predicted metal-dependent peptidase